MSNLTDSEAIRRREVSLVQAVQHHGLANHANSEGNTPASAQKVIETAQQFEAYISSGEAPPSRRR